MKKIFLLTKTLLVIVLLCVGASNAWGQDAGIYYIQNVGTGKWLSPANSWETQASVLSHADYWKLAKVSDGVYTLESVVSNGGTSYYLNGTYCDQPTTNLTFAAVAGKDNTYTISKGSANTYLTTDGSAVSDNGSDATSENAQWRLYTLSDLTTLMASATPASGVDATFFIKDHNLSRNNRDYSSAWSNTGATAPGSSDKNTAATTRYSIEAFQKTFNVNQTVTNIPNGVYGVQVNGFYRQDGSDANLPYVFAGTNKTTLPSRTGTENSMQEAATSFASGNYLSNSASFLVTDGTLNLGVATSGTSCWSIFKNFHLYYYGNPTVANPLNMTSWIVNPDIEVDGAGTGSTYKRDVTGWSHNNSDGNYRPLAVPSGNNESGAFTNSYCFEIYKDGGLAGKKMYQKVIGLPNGVFKLQLAAMINGAATDEFIYASSNGQVFKKTLDGTASQSKDYEVYAIVTDGTLEIGLDMNTSVLKWAIIDNARLTYYGASTEAYALVQPSTISVTSLPVSYPMSSAGAVNPFSGGSITTGANITALKVTQEEVKTWIDADLTAEGCQPLVPENSERVNISFTAYHGWESTANTTTTVKVYNSKDEELIAYTYTLNACNVTDVSLGGSPVAGFAAFAGQSSYNGSGGANGISVGDRSFKSNSGYNLNVKMSLAKDGRVWLSAIGGKSSVDKEYTALLDKDIDLAYIVINDASSDGGRSFCMTDLSVNVETPTIPSLPTSTYTFDSDTTPFTNGTVVSAKNVGNVLLVNNTTAKATFAAKSGKGWNYEPGERETVTIEFDAYNGYLNSGKTSTVSILNSDGVVLAGYTYKTTNYVTDVKLGGETPDGFAQFTGISKNGSNNANGYEDGTKPFVTTAGYNPHVTMTISGNGKVSFKFDCSAQLGDDNPKYFEKTLDGVKMDIAAITIVDNNSTNPNRSSCFDNLSITTYTTPVTTPVIIPVDKAYFAETQNVSISCETAGATIHYTTDGTTPTASSTTYSAPFEISATTTVKAIAICDTYADSEIASATINKLHTQTNVTGKETWDWTVENDGISAYTAESTPKNTDEIVLSNVEFYNNFSIPAGFGDAQKLKVIAQYPFRKSGSEYYFQGSTIKFTTEVPGTIDVDFSNTGSNGDRYLQLNGENTAFKSGNTTKVSATNIPVAAGDITLTASTGYFHFFKIVFTPTLNTKGYSTFSSSNNVQVSGAKAYTATLDFEKEEITCTEIADGKIPAGNGVLIFGDGTEAVTYTTIAEAPALGANDLKATTDAEGNLATMTEGHNYYVLSGDTFMRYTGGSFTAGKAYFDVAAGVVQARSMRIVFDSVTGINEAKAEAKAEKDGKFFEKGQLVIYKNGKKFNANGTQMK